MVSIRSCLSHVIDNGAKKIIFSVRPGGGPGVGPVMLLPTHTGVRDYGIRVRVRAGCVSRDP